MTSPDIAILYPADYFDNAKADDTFEAERQIALDMGFQVATYDFDDGKVRSRIPSGAERASVSLLRGWQAPSPTYYPDVVYPLLEGLGEPLTDPEQYACLRDSERYAPLVSDLMPASENISWDEAMEPGALEGMLDAFGGRAFAKDYVKSVYGLKMIELDDDGSADGAREVLAKIREARGDAFAGGFCIKEWCDFTEQVRVFVLDGKIVLCVEHDGVWSGKVPENVPLDLPSRFYTVDMGFDSTSGRWLVVECGDAQESDCGSEGDMRALYDAIASTC